MTKTKETMIIDKRKYFNYDINMGNLFVFGICVRSM